MTRRVSILFLTGAIGVRAQDLRHVTEPVFPPVCTSLTARNSWPVHEDRADTPRIQAALDGCAAGQAVELKSAGTEDSFLSGPLFLRKGVTLRDDTLCFAQSARLRSAAGELRHHQ